MQALKYHSQPLEKIHYNGNEKFHCSKRTNIITMNFIMIVVSRDSLVVVVFCLFVIIIIIIIIIIIYDYYLACKNCLILQLR